MAHGVHGAGKSAVEWRGNVRLAGGAGEWMNDDAKKVLGYTGLE